MPAGPVTRRRRLGLVDCSVPGEELCVAAQHLDPLGGKTRIDLIHRSRGTTEAEVDEGIPDGTALA